MEKVTDEAENGTKYTWKVFKKICTATKSRPENYLVQCFLTLTPLLLWILSTNRCFFSPKMPLFSGRRTQIQRT